MSYTLPVYDSGLRTDHDCPTPRRHTFIIPIVSSGKLLE